MSHRNTTTAVIGGGAAGCAAAHELARAGHRVMLFEGEPHLGGRCSTLYRHGVTVDTGAGFYTNYYPLLQRYLTRLGLQQDSVALSRRAIFMREGRMTTIELGHPRSLLAFPHLSWKKKARLAVYLARLHAHRHRLDLADPATLAHYDDRPAADYARAHLGESIYQYLVRPSVEPFWYTSCKDTSRALVMALHAQFPTTRFYALRSGTATLCNRLCRGLEVHVNTRVQSMVRHFDGRFRLGFRGPHGGCHETGFDSVVVATRADQASRLVEALPTEMVSADQRSFLRSQRYQAVLHAAYVADQRPALANVSLVTHFGPGAGAVAGIGFHAQKYPDSALQRSRQELVSVYAVPNRGEDLGAAPAEDLWQRARSLCPLLPARADPMCRVWRENAMPRHEVGRYRLAEQFRSEQRAPLGFAGDYLATTTLEGALRSGVWAAGVVLGRRLPGAEP